MYKVHPLTVGEAEVGAVLDVFWSLTKASRRLTVPILAFLIEGGPKPILVDTGMRDPARATDGHRLGPHRMRPEWTLEAQLARHGVAPEDVETVILTPAALRPRRRLRATPGGPVRGAAAPS